MKDGKISLRRADSDEVVEIPINRLAEEDRKVASQIWFDRQDTKQFEMVRDHLDALYDRPAAVSRLLLEIHKAVPDSPYAGIWAAVGMSAGENQVPRSTAILNEAIRRIREQQESVPGRHSMTLASALNNLAVCQIKERNPDRAAAALANAMESSSVVSSVIRHNVQLLMEAGASKYSPLDVPDRNRQRLMATLARSEVAGVKAEFRDGWYYALDFRNRSEITSSNPVS